MKPIIDIIVPTYNQPQLLAQMLSSINGCAYGPISSLLNIVVVNNGRPEMLEPHRKAFANVTFLQPEGNLGWEGGLKYALERTSAPLVMFANDDIRFIQGNKDGLFKLIASFNDPAIGAVGPCSNYVMGPQNIFQDTADVVLQVKYLIGFCLLVRREALEKAGGVDDSLPGGDDIDLSIRLTDAGYKLIARRDVFVFHHGSATGNSAQPGYWNSPVMQEKTNLAIIRKHGMIKFWETMVCGWMRFEPYTAIGYTAHDAEGDICRKHVIGEKILELGCGGRKTVESAVGIDLLPAGCTIPHVTTGNEACVADRVGDVSVALPIEAGTQDTIIARHVLEHCQDPLGTLMVWNKSLRIGGHLIVAVPNQELGNTMMMNPEHINSFVPASLVRLADAAGFAPKFVYTVVNGVSFVAVLEKLAEAPVTIVNETVAPKAARLEAVA